VDRAHSAGHDLANTGVRLASDSVINSASDKPQVLEHALFAGFLAAAVLSYAAGSLIGTRAALAAGLILTVITFVTTRTEWSHVHLNGLVFVLAVTVSGVVAGRSGLRESFFAAASIGPTLYVLRSGPRRALIAVIAAPLLAFFGWHMLQGSDPNVILGWSSQNGISVLGLVLCSLYYLRSARLGEVPSLVPATMLLLVSIWANGRSGIVVAALMFGGVAVLRSAWLMLGGMASAVVVLLLNPSIALAIAVPLFGESFLGRFVMLGLQSPLRKLVLSNYIERLDIVSVLFGANLERQDYIEFLLYNSHNSWLNLHAVSGAYFFLFLGLATAAGILAWRRRRPMMALLLALLVMRFSSDGDLYVGLFDFVPFALVFASIGPLMTATAARPRPQELDGQRFA
jgi:hypothetical protein